ncbi:MAG: NHL repeat containing protein [Parcubacteria group bacterium GW2011_GWF2_43_38]|nr:MAG: NHL repeat containing protein [Parcubacteria group bacterium GW2011_GWF2_43_38]
MNGKNCTVFASGLRNTVDFVEHQGAIYGTDNGRDQLGNTLPPEEINKLVAGGNYGWPICYGQQLHDTNFDKNVYIRDPCADTIAPAVELPAHNAPLGLAFYQGEEFPPDYQGDLFVAAHGSWNRQPPDGYKVFRIDWQTKKVSDFITGWLSGTTVRGRPVGVVNYQGGLLVSDDAGGIIYFVRYSP